MAFVRIFLFFIAGGALFLHSWNDCPFNQVNDTYPGLCGRYVDRNNDSICDHSQPPPLSSSQPNPQNLSSNTSEKERQEQSRSSPIERHDTVKQQLRVYSLAHAFFSTISALLIVLLSLQFAFRKPAFHKQIAIMMALTGIIGLIFSFLFGISFTLDLKGFHNIVGFISLGLSLLPFFVKSSRGKLHCWCAYGAAFFALLAIISGFVAYWDLLFS